ncbi:MAG: hypothetical protein KAQ99_03380 [Candidatus Aureabacteria bacterium]|nr:hypothetical protein [Candidatus Auribacterota bacterium]
MKKTILSILMLCVVNFCFANNIYRDENTPESVIQNLLIASAKNDKESVLKIIITRFKNDELLWQSPPPSSDNTLLELFGSMQFRRVKGGETITIRGGKKVFIPEDKITEDICLIYPIIKGKESPTPLWVLRKAGIWKVDPRPLIKAAIVAKKYACGDSSSGASSTKQIVREYNVAIKNKSTASIQQFICWENIPKQMKPLYENWLRNQLQAFELIKVDYSPVRDGKMLNGTQIEIVGKIVTQAKAKTSLTWEGRKIKKGEPMPGPFILIGCKNNRYYIIFERDKAAETYINIYY